MPSRTSEKLVTGIKTFQNDEAISLILRREVLGMSHFKFWLNQAYLYLCSLKIANLHVAVVHKPFHNGLQSQAGAIPSANQYTKCCCSSDLSQSNTRSPHHKGLHDQNQKFNKKHTPLLCSCTSEMKQHWYWSAWCWQPHCATNTLASWEQALKIIIKIQYTGCCEDQIGNKKLRCNGSVLGCFTSAGFIWAAKKTWPLPSFSPQGCTTRNLEMNDCNGPSLRRRAQKRKIFSSSLFQIWWDMNKAPFSNYLKE